MNTIPTAVWEGELRVGPVCIPCYVLDDGRRVLSVNGVDALLAYFATGGELTADEARAVARFVAATEPEVPR